MDESKYSERLKNTGRNEPCPCGSGKKYKKCHLDADEMKRHEELAKQEELRAAESDQGEEIKEESNSATKVKPERNDKRGPGGINRAGKSHKSPNIPRRSAM